MLRKKIVAGNWKMNLRLRDARTLVSELVNMYQAEVNGRVPMWLFPPASYLYPLSGLLQATLGVSMGAQDCSANKEGAFTGELNVHMLSDAGATLVLIGHSERRQYHAEGNELLRLKLQNALELGLTPVFCIGETLAQRQDGKLQDVISKQLEPILAVTNHTWRNQIVLAYEPVWAIGTGVTASPEQAQEVHAFIRSLFVSAWGMEFAERLIILYGGSVNAKNAKELFSQPDIDGGLVGGASLKSREFIEIVKSCL